VVGGVVGQGSARAVDAGAERRTEPVPGAVQVELEEGDVVAVIQQDGADGTALAVDADVLVVGAQVEVLDVQDAGFGGAPAVTRAVLPVMRRQRSGRVLNITSVGGFTAGQGGVYGSTKFAVEGISEAMRAELAPLGIDVIIIEPGVFRTDFLDDSSLHTTEQVIEDYAETAGQTRAGGPRTTTPRPVTRRRRPPRSSPSPGPAIRRSGFS
jgi:NAD(P)-dependent dehydrogenase (short-subunit alcohol dehydrogenase family)